MADNGKVGDNDVVVDVVTDRATIRITPRTSGNFGGDDLDVQERRLDTGVREITITPRPKVAEPGDGITVTNSGSDIG